MSEPFFSEYPADVRRQVFAGRRVSPILPYKDAPAKLRHAGLPQGKLISISGTQDKYSVVLEPPRLRFCVEGEHGAFILKPCLRSDLMRHRESPANELLCMQLMQRVFHVPAAACALCFFQNGAPAYITRRFDRTPEGRPLKFEDFASLSGLLGGDANRKYTGSYQDMARLIELYSGAPAVDMETFFRLVLGNYLLCNGDAHLKNFALLENAAGEMRLAPAYDVMNTRLHIRNDSPFAMESGLFADARRPGRAVGAHFREWGLAIGIAPVRVDAFLHQFLDARPAVENAVQQSFLSPAARRAFIYETRQRFTRLARL